MSWSQLAKTTCPRHPAGGVSQVSVDMFDRRGEAIMAG
jgi:hypothetical protein